METIKVENILMNLIDRPAIPDRVSIAAEYIKELAASIVEIGLLNPISLRSKNGRYEIIAGDCRFQAFLSVGKETIPAIISDVDEKNCSIARATENLQRENLTPVEEARIYLRLNETHGMNWEQIGKRIGKSAGLVKRRTDILRMPEILQDALQKKQVSVGVAEELWRITDKTALEYYLSFAVDNGVTVSVARQWAQEYEKTQREVNPNAGGGGGFRHPNDLKPVYVACDLCREAMELGQESVLRCCPDCAKAISEIIKGK